MKISEKLSGLFVVMQRLFPRKHGFIKPVDHKSSEDSKKPSNTYGEFSSFDEIEKQNVLEDLVLIQNKLEHAYVVFNFQTNIDLIESSIYYIESLESKYNYLIKRAREMQLRCDLKSV